MPILALIMSEDRPAKRKKLTEDEEPNQVRK